MGEEIDQGEYRKEHKRISSALEGQTIAKVIFPEYRGVAPGVAPDPDCIEGILFESGDLLYLQGSDNIGAHDIYAIAESTMSWRRNDART